MKKPHLTLKNTLGAAVIPVALAIPVAAFATASPSSSAKSAAAPAQAPSPGDLKSKVDKQVVKEAADAANATQAALKALERNQPEQAHAALEVASGNLHLLLTRAPSLGLIPIDMQVRVFEGVTDLKTIKELEDKLDDLIDDGKYQTARPILDSLADEIRVNTLYLPLATYPSTINQIAPLIDQGKIDEAKQALVDLLETFVSEEEITPLSIIRAEEKLSEAFQLQRKGDLSKAGIKDRISRLVNEAHQNVKVAEALGYGSKKDYEPLYDSMDALRKSIGTTGFEGEWLKIKKSLSGFKNKIVHTPG